MQSKQCPRCKRMRPLDELDCSGCGYQFPIGSVRATAPPPPRASSQQRPTPPPTPPPVQPPTITPWDAARMRQHPSVVRDPKYLLDSNYGFGCFRCGSRHLNPVTKPGLGMGFLGPIGVICLISLVEDEVRRYQKQPFECGYCQFVFTLQ